MHDLYIKNVLNVYRRTHGHTSSPYHKL